MPLRPATAAPDADLTARVHAVLDARLGRDAPYPVAIALSGGGDSMALLALAADWARARGRRLQALTVDHGLNPDSARWSALSRRAARALGADWRELAWTGAKPTTGLPAAARRARHALIADAARTAGARVVLFAHTADDVAEGDWMRAGGSTLGRLRPWAPSPAWPEGRGLMLLRPLLDERREDLRRWLAARGLDWIEDPANDDPRFGRTRARRALAGAGEVEPIRTADVAMPVIASAHHLTLPRICDARTLAAAVVCAGGGDDVPRGDRLARLIGRLRAGEDFTAVLVGARITADGEEVRVSREAGEFARRPIAPLPLAPGVAAVWDGRFEIGAPEAGWSVVPAQGRMAELPPADRAMLAALPADVRGTLPVLIRDDAGAPILAWRAARVRGLVGERLALALDQTTHERDLAAGTHGATASDPLFSDDTFKTGRGVAPSGKPRTA